MEAGMNRAAGFGLAMMVVMGLVLSASVATAGTVAGVWKLDVQTAAGSGTPTLDLKVDGEKLSGIYSGQLGETEIVGSTKADTFTLTFETGGIQVTYKGTFDATTMEGTVDLGSYGTGTFTGVREDVAPAAAPAPEAQPAAPAAAEEGTSDLVGFWLLDVQTAVGSGTPTMDIKVDGEKVTGFYSGQLGQTEFTGNTSDNEFSIHFDSNGVEIIYRGTFDATSMKGEVILGSFGTGDFTGVKKEK